MEQPYVPLQFSRPLFSLAIILFSHITFAEPLSTNPAPLPLRVNIVPQAPVLNAKSYILVDKDNGVVLAQKESDLKVEPASITKMMTIYVADHEMQKGKLKLTDLVRVSHKSWKMTGSRMFLNVNSEVSVGDLVKGIIIQSGNDASIALAEHIAGSEEAFVDMMNSYAQRLGMHNTHFMNVTGMPDSNHYTTARDLSALAIALIKEFPETYKLYSEKWFTFQNIRQPNRNQLLWRNDLVDGIKTGHTDTAGFCLVASGKKEQMRLIAVVMGTQSENSRSDETNKLLTYGFRFFETHKLYSAGTKLQVARLWFGKEKNINVGLLEDTHVTIAQGQYEKLQLAVVINKNIKAPISEGQSLGTLTVKMGDAVILEKPLVALESVAEGGFLSRMYDHIAFTLCNLWEKIVG